MCEEVEVGGAGKVKWGGCGVCACKCVHPCGRMRGVGGWVGGVVIVLLER